MGEFAPPPHFPPVRRKNVQNQQFLAKFWIFAPSETHFASSMPSHKKQKQKQKKSGAATE